MRLNMRRNVDLPQPEGPISAMTDRSAIFRVMSNRACRGPYQKERLRTSNLVTSPCRTTSRPVSFRSERMAAYDILDKGNTSQRCQESAISAEKVLLNVDS